MIFWIKSYDLNPSNESCLDTSAAIRMIKIRKIHKSRQSRKSKTIFDKAHKVNFSNVT
jgi:hypothetical protein